MELTGYDWVHCKNMPAYKNFTSRTPSISIPESWFMIFIQKYMESESTLQHYQRWGRQRQLLLLWNARLLALPCTLPRLKLSPLPPSLTRVCFKSLCNVVIFVTWKVKPQNILYGFIHNGVALQGFITNHWSSTKWTVYLTSKILYKKV